MNFFLHSAYIKNSSKNLCRPNMTRNANSHKHAWDWFIYGHTLQSKMRQDKTSLWSVRETKRAVPEDRKNNVHVHIYVSQVYYIFLHKPEIHLSTPYINHIIDKVNKIVYFCQYRTHFNRSTEMHEDNLSGCETKSEANNSFPTVVFI